MMALAILDFILVFLYGLLTIIHLPAWNGWCYLVCTFLWLLCAILNVKQYRDRKRREETIKNIESMINKLDKDLEGYKDLDPK